VSSFGASPTEQHIGLGKSAQIITLEVSWPVSGTQQTFSKIAKNQFLEIKEFAQEPTPLQRRAVHLGGAHPPASGIATTPRPNTTP
jgi:hypothetical protein